MSRKLPALCTYSAVVVLTCAVLFICGCTQETTISGTISDSGGTVTVTHHIVWDPPGSYLVNFDATQALLNLSLTNSTIATTSGTATVTVKNLSNNQTVGQNSFAYVVRGNSLYAQDPTAVYNWLQNFTSYASIDVLVDMNTPLQPLSDGVVGVTRQAQYQGTTFASSTSSLTFTSRSGGGKQQQ